MTPRQRPRAAAIALALGVLAAASRASAPLLASASVPRAEYESQVVMLVVTSQDYDEWRPWEKETPETHNVQAVVLDGSRLITTADLVQNATIILAEKHGRPLRTPARVVHVDPDANLALLTVDAPGFFDDLRPAVLASAAPTEGAANAVRWRGGPLEVSAGRIASVEVGSTYLGALEHASLMMETDLSSGGWGEPVFAGGRLIGITYSQEGQGATVTPVDILRAYLDAVRAAGGYRGFANFDVYWQINRDPALARELGLEGEPRGVVITGVPAGSSACGALFPRDILLSLDGHPIDSAGYYDDRSAGRLQMAQIVVAGHRAGDVIPGEVLRAGRKVPIRMTLRAALAARDLMPARSGGAAPPYLVAGGLVFRELNGDFLRTWGKDWRKKAPPFLLTRYDLFRATQTETHRRVVLLAYVLPSAYNIGYGDLQTLPVARINGRPIDSVAAVDDALRHPQGDFDRIELEPNPVRSDVVLDAAGLEDATRAILDAYGIPERMRLPAQAPPDLGGPCPDHP